MALEILPPRQCFENAVSFLELSQNGIELVRSSPSPTSPSPFESAQWQPNARKASAGRVVVGVVRHAERADDTNSFDECLGVPISVEKPDVVFQNVYNL